MQRHLAVMIPIVLALASGTVSAQTVRLDHYRNPEPKLKDWYKMYLAGVRDGLIVYSARRGAKDRAFCLPPDKILTVEQAEDIMLRFAEKRQTPGEAPIALPLLGGLAEAFPCEEKQDSKP